jgi:hypothetical protein
MIVKKLLDRFATFALRHRTERYEQELNKLLQVYESQDEADALRFAPELLELRAKVIEQLAEDGVLWLSHYSSVDMLHDVYGVEVCGIKDKDCAKAVYASLVRQLPEFMFRKTCYKDDGRDPSFVVSLHRHKPPNSQDVDLSTGPDAQIGNQ